MIELLVLADDRTGALETAGICADAGWGSVPAVVHPDTAPESAPVVVVDLGSRHLAGDDAAALAVLAAAATPSRRAAHKIDSTLRGNWAEEVVARHRATGGRVLVVAAFPAVGRTCVGGVVHVDGVPLAVGSDTDPRRGAPSNRPADLLRAAGAPAVAELAGAADVAVWAANPDSPRFAVCDAMSTSDLAAAGRAWAQLDGVLLAGTAAAVGAGAAALVTDPVDSVAVPVVAPVLVVCGSLHPVARAQVAALHRHAAAEVVRPAGDLDTAVAALRDRRPVVLQTEATRPGDDVSAQIAAAELAAAVRTVMAGVDLGTLVVIGGDTAAAVLGPRPVAVGGTLAPGIPWARHLDGGPLLVTKAGGFGDDETLLRLVPGRMGG